MSLTSDEVPASSGLDAIQVFWSDMGLNEGLVVITCSGCTREAYCRAMGGRTIKQFFHDADVGCLVTKLETPPLLKQRKADLSYLGKIVRAIKHHIDTQADSQESETK